MGKVQIDEIRYTNLIWFYSILHMRVAVANIQLVTTPKAAVLEFIFTPCNYPGIPEHSWKTAGCRHRSDNPLKLLIRIRDSPIYLWFQILSDDTVNC